jgi:hypothetical protein
MTDEVVEELLRTAMRFKGGIDPGKFLRGVKW